MSVVGVGDFPAAFGGYYLGEVPAGTYAVSATANGYTLNDTDVAIPQGGLVTENFGLDPIPKAGKGDVNRDDSVDLADAILALKVACEMGTSGENITVDADVNGDGKIGLAEVLYILEDISGLRP